LAEKTVFWNFALPFLLYRARDWRWILQGIVESEKPLRAFLNWKRCSLTRRSRAIATQIGLLSRGKPDLTHSQPLHCSDGPWP